VLLCVAVCCSVKRRVAVCCAVSERGVRVLTIYVEPEDVLQCVAVCCSVLQCVLVRSVCAETPSPEDKCPPPFWRPNIHTRENNVREDIHEENVTCEKIAKILSIKEKS